MSQRAGLFEDADDFDVSAFTPKKAARTGEPPSEAVRAVSEGVDFKSREPLHTPAKKTQRRRRTGRNLQLSLKVDEKTLEAFYKITDGQNWCLGETLERAVAALQRELGDEN
jgi:hypothetical protein